MARKVLIVEDNVSLRDMYKVVFDAAGYEVETAEDGTFAVDMVKSNTYDIILLDIMMPNMNGVETLKEFRKDDSLVADVPVLLLTNMGQDNIIEQAFEIGADGFLLKANLLPQQVVDTVEKFLDGEITSKDLGIEKKRLG